MWRPIASPKVCRVISPLHYIKREELTISPIITLILQPLQTFGVNRLLHDPCYTKSRRPMKWYINNNECAILSIGFRVMIYIPSFSNSPFLTCLISKSGKPSDPASVTSCCLASEEWPGIPRHIVAPKNNHSRAMNIVIPGARYLVEKSNNVYKSCCKSNYSDLVYWRSGKMYDKHFKEFWLTLRGYIKRENKLHQQSRKGQKASLNFLVFFSLFFLSVIFRRILHLRVFTGLFHTNLK